MQNVSYSYEDLFQRNIGVFTAEEQERIRGLVVAIAGAGGLGGPVAYNLARLGVGEIRLADPEVFEPSNTNRQWGCYADTIGVNKAEAVAVELRRINPTLVAKAWPCALGEDNVSAFLDGASFVVDGIDFFALESELALHEAARQTFLWVYALQGVQELLTSTAFDPNSRGLEEMVFDDGVVSPRQVVSSFFPVLPHDVTWDDIDTLLAQGEVDHVPSTSVLPSVGGGYS